MVNLDSIKDKVSGKIADYTVPTLNLDQFIQQVKKEIIETQKKHAGEQAFFILNGIELEVNVVAGISGDGKVKLHVVEMDTELSKARTHRVKLNLGVVDNTSSSFQGQHSFNTMPTVRPGGIYPMSYPYQPSQFPPPIIPPYLWGHSSQDWGAPYSPILPDRPDQEADQDSD